MINNGHGQDPRPQNHYGPGPDHFAPGTGYQDYRDGPGGRYEQDYDHHQRGHPSEQYYDEHSRVPVDYPMEPPGPGPLDYQKYTEDRTETEAAPLTDYEKIDPDTGIAPRRLTDCVCLVIFLFFVTGMLLLVIVVRAQPNDIRGRPYTDTRRLTHGFDYKADLCGVDSNVQDRPYLYWCRSSSSDPSALNLRYPTCVSSCPKDGSLQIPCFEMDTPTRCFSGSPDDLAAEAGAIDCRGLVGDFGSALVYFVRGQEQVVNTTSYSTVAKDGRFCIPTDPAMEKAVMHPVTGPMNVATRTYYAFGSLEDPWLVIFLSVLCTAILSFIFVLAVLSIHNFAAILTLIAFAIVTAAFFVVATLLTLTIVVYCIAPDDDSAANSNAFVKFMVAWNPILPRYTRNVATVLSLLAGGVLMTVAGMMLGVARYTYNFRHQIDVLIETTAECVFSMKLMLVPPFIEAIVKFLFSWILLSNLRVLLAVGRYDNYRIVVNEQLFRGLTASFNPDYSIWFWVLLYIVGTIWIIELCTAFGQFLISFCVVSWYFIPKDEDGEKAAPPLPPIRRSAVAIWYHCGTLIFGALVLPYLRPLRMLGWLLTECLRVGCCCCKRGDAEPDITLSCLCVGGVCCWCPLPRALDPERCSKNNYIDTIIRSQHFTYAGDRTLAIIQSHKQVMNFMGMARGTAFTGVVCMAACGAAITGALLTTSRYNDPKNNPSTFIQDPVWVIMLSFALCGSVAYGFMAVFDVSLDAMLYCFAHNRKANKRTVDKYVPAMLGDLIGYVEGVDDDLSFPYYGQAKPQMFLSTYMKQRPQDQGILNNAVNTHVLGRQGYSRTAAAASSSQYPGVLAGSQVMQSSAGMGYGQRY